MQVTNKIHSIWKSKRQYSVGTAISRESGISVHTICRALRDGRGSRETILAINNFFKIDTITEKQKKARVRSFA